MKTYNKHTITNGDNDYSIEQVGEYMYRIKDLTRNTYLRNANTNHKPKTLFSNDQVKRFALAMRCWVKED